MYFLLFIVILIIVYVASFKDSFTQENIEKVAPVLLLVTLFVVAVCILSIIL